MQRYDIQCLRKRLMSPADDTPNLAGSGPSNTLSVHTLVGSDVLRMPETSLPT